MMKAVLTLLLPVLTLVMLESCSRALITLRQDLARPPLEMHTLGEPSRELGWEAFRSDPMRLADTGEPRIVAIGDSTTHGFGVRPGAAWPEVLDRALPHVTVANMATPGYSSFQGYRTLVKYGDRLRPAAIIASFSYNDRGYVYKQNIDSAEKFARFYDEHHKLGQFGWLDHIYTARILRSAMRRLGMIRPGPEVEIDVRTLQARVPPESYRENLRKIAEYGRTRNIPVIFILLKDNPHHTSQITAGIEYLARGEHQRAIRAFAIGLNDQVSESLARKYLAQAYAAVGDNDKAAEAGHIQAMRETVGGFQPIYLDFEYHAIMLEVGRQMGVAVVDARPVLDENNDMFIDMSHPDERGHERIAALLLEAIKIVAPSLAKGAVGVSNNKGHREPDNELLGALEAQSVTH
jgi:lysophospholipase L1-like esterase